MFCCSAGTDGYSLFLWDAPNASVYQLTAASIGVGFQDVEGAVSGGYGRKFYLSGTQSGGCWMSMDYSARE